MTRLKILGVPLLLISAMCSGAAAAADECPMDANYKLPENAPVLTLNNKKPNWLVPIVNLKEGESVNAKCEVEGGTPPVSSVTLKCGANSNTAQGTQVSLTFIASNGRSSDSCVCKAEHPSGCYNRKSKAYLITNYQSRITRFTANNQTQVLEVDQGQTVALRCQADGNPSPRLDIKGRNTGNSPFGSGSFVTTDQILWHRTATCDFADVYDCTADNDWDSKAVDDKKSMEVKVKACDGASIKNNIKVNSFVTTGLGSGGGTVISGNFVKNVSNIINVGNIVVDNPLKLFKGTNDTVPSQSPVGNLGTFISNSLESSLGWLGALRREVKNNSD